MKLSDYIAPVVGLTAIVGVCTGIACVIHSATAPTEPVVADAGEVVGGAPIFPIFGTLVTPDAGVDAMLSTTSHCFPWAGGSAPAGVTWYQTLVSVDTDDDDRGLLLTASASPDAGVSGNRYLVLQVGVQAGDAGVNELSHLHAFLLAHHVHEIERGYRCRIGTAGCAAAPNNTACEVWADRVADVANPSQCMCGSGCQTSTNGTNWTAAGGGEVYGKPYGMRVRASGAGNCRRVPCGLLAGDEHALDGVCQ